MKKKKKMDPMQFKLKVERKVKKLEKEIRKLSKTKPQLKPLIEYQLPPEILKDLNTRKRKEAGLEEAEEQMSKIAYLCNVYRSEQVKQEMHSFRNMVRSQSKALKELRECSEQLYQAAISIDQNLIPFSDLKSVKLTPAVKDYTPPDGRKHDITKQWK
ncbi:39S ribosomal protein L40-like protein, partial [Dinothrombium tinctorium]